MQIDQCCKILQTCDFTGYSIFLPANNLHQKIHVGQADMIEPFKTKLSYSRKWSKIKLSLTQELCTSNRILSCYSGAWLSVLVHLEQRWKSGMFRSSNPELIGISRQESNQKNASNVRWWNMRLYHTEKKKSTCQRHAEVKEKGIMCTRGTNMDECRMFEKHS